MGWVFTAAEAPTGVAPPPVAVISYPFWKTHFASSPDVLGKVLELNQQKYIVIGVVGPRFTWHDSEVSLPMPAGIRAEGVTPITTAGLAASPRDATWRADFVKAMGDFPVGQHDDMTEAFCHAMKAFTAICP